MKLQAILKEKKKSLNSCKQEQTAQLWPSLHLPVSMSQSGQSFQREMLARSKKSSLLPH